jgi:hypothetical protein
VLGFGASRDRAQGSVRCPRGPDVGASRGRVR